MMDTKKKIQPTGMYGETPKVQIGKYSISRQSEDSVWIEHESGEGGEFPKSLLETYIHEFYKKHF